MSYTRLLPMSGFGDDSSNNTLILSKQDGECRGMTVLDKGFFYDSCECPKDMPVRYGWYCGSTMEEAKARSDKASDCELGGQKYDPSTNECAGVIPGHPETGWIDPRAGTPCGSNAIYNTSGDCVDLSTPKPNASSSGGGSGSPSATPHVLAQTQSENSTLPLVMAAVLAVFVVLVLAKKGDRK